MKNAPLYSFSKGSNLFILEERVLFSFFLICNIELIFFSFSCWKFLGIDHITFFKILYIYYSWRLITLQYCGAFCHTLTWINHGYTRVPLSQTPFPPPSPSHPSGLSQSTGFECPVSRIELVLVIYFTYGNIHVSMLFSQTIPPSPSPTESKSLFFTSVSLLLSCI